MQCYSTLGSRNMVSNLIVTSAINFLLKKGYLLQTKVNTKNDLPPAALNSILWVTGYV